MSWLKQSTAATIKIGPCLDPDGVEYTGLVIGDIEIDKNGTEAAMAAAATLTHEANGHYELVLTTGNTDTLGRLRIYCNKATYQFPPVECLVLPANTYDSLVAGSDVLDVSLIQWLGTAPLALSSQQVQAIVPNTQKVDVETIKTQALTAAAGIAFGVYVGGTGAAALEATSQTILADTNELETDWGDGGRLDLILDARASQTSVDNLPTVAAFEARTLTAAEYAVAATALSTATWTATRAGYLDNLSAGAVALESSVTAIQNNTRNSTTVPEVIERPDSGTTTYRIELFLYDTNGNMEAPDSAPTLSLVNQSGTDRSARLDSTTMALVSTGRYRVIYTSDAADTLEQLIWVFSVTEGGATRLIGRQSLIVDTTAVDFTAADRSKLEATYNKLPINNIADQTLITASIDALNDVSAADVVTAMGTGTFLTAIPWNAAWDAEVESEATDALNAYDPPTNAEMEARTLLAASYATAANQTTIAGYIDTEVAAILAAVDTEVTAIKAKTDQLVFTVPNQVDANALSGGGLDAAGVRAAVGLAAANLDTQLGDLPTNAEFSAALAAADDATLLAISDVQTTIDGIAVETGYLVAATGQVSDLAPTATSFKTNLAAANDTYNDQLLHFTSGALAKQAKPILDYTLTDGVVTFDEGFTAAPANGDQFAILVDHIHPVSQIQSGLATQSSVDSLPSVSDIVDGMTGDSITPAKAFELLAAFLCGKVSATSASGVTTYSYKKRDGTTQSFTSVCSEEDGTRSTTGSLS